MASAYEIQTVKQAITGGSETRSPD